MKFSYLHFVFLYFMLISCTKSDVVFEYVDPLNKVLSETTLFMSTKAEADVVRGESATYQFAIRAAVPLRNVTVKLAKLTHTTAKVTLPLEKMKISFVGHVHVGRAQAEPGSDLIQAPSDFYPDPLFDDSIIDINAGTTMTSWLSIPIALESIPGKYCGEVILEAKVNGRTVEERREITLNVYSPVINQQTLMVTNWYQPGFNCVDGTDVPQFSERWWVLMNQVADFMKEYRQNVVMIAPMRLADYTFQNGEVTIIDFKQFDKVVQFFIDKGILKKIAGGHIAGRCGGWTSAFGYLMPIEKEGKITIELVDYNDAKAKKFYKKFFAELMLHLEKKGWEDMYIQHIADEPIKSNSDSYIAISSYVKELLPEIKIVDACHTKDLDNQIDVWIPQLNYLHKDFDFYQAQQAKGKEVWYYTCVWPQGEYANRYIQQPLIKTRLLHWINYKYNINGYLHWGLNFWRGDNPLIETAAIQPDGLVLPAGDAWVVYPYKNHLVPSIRLEAMRDGIIDYELLRMLEKKNPELAMKLANTLVYDFDKYDTDIVHFRAIRKQLLTALENLK